MSVTLIQSPDAYRPAYNPIEWVFDSTNKLSCDFRYVCDLYVNGSFAIRLKAFPDTGNSSYGTFRVDRVLRDFLSSDLADGLVGFAGMPDSVCSYQLQIIERYNTSADCTGAVTDSSVLYTSSTCYAWNGALQYSQGPTYAEDRYVASGPDTKFMSGSPSRFSVKDGSSFTLSFLQDGSGSPPVGDVDDVEVQTYTSANALIGTYVIDNTVTTVSTVSNRMVNVGAGPKDLNASTLASGSQPVITASVAYYKVFLRNSSTDQISEAKTIDVDRRCTQYRPFRLWWLSRLGGFDSFTFDIYAPRTVNISRTSFNRIISSFMYAPGDRGTTTSQVTAQETLTLTSNWLTEAEGLWMEELFTSPEVFMTFLDDPQTYIITGGQYNAGTADLVIDLGVVLPTGTPFTYQVASGASIGMANSGSGQITGYDSITGYHHTTVVSTVNAGAILSGTMSATIYRKVPVVVSSTSFDEKRKVALKSINYTVDVQPAYALNIQSQ